MEPWFLLEPLAPLDQILPEHIAYVRMVMARFSVTPAHWREDLVQEVLLQAHRSRQSRLEVRALLFGITRHVVLKWIAKRNAERTAVALHALSPLITERSVEDEWQEAQRRETVRAAIEDLPVPFREVFVRSELEHRTMPEIARALGIPVNTGYTRLHGARARFLESLHRLFARRRIQKQDLSIPVAIGVSGALEGAPGGGVAAHDPVSPQVGAGKLGLIRHAEAFGKLASWLGVATFAAGAAVVVTWAALKMKSDPPRAIAVPEPYAAPSAIDEPASPATDPAPLAPPSIPRAPLAEASSRAERPVDAPLANSGEPAAEPNGAAAAASAAAMEAARIAEGLAARYVMDLAKAGHPEEATIAAAAFWEKYPASPYTVSIQESIQESLRRRPPPVMETR